MMKWNGANTQRVILVAAASGALVFGATKEASACTVYQSGAIGVKWTSLGGASSYEGQCMDDEHDDGVGNGGWIETFQNGHIDYPGFGPAYAVHGNIDQSWMARGGPAGYGQAKTDEVTFGALGMDGCDVCKINQFYIQSAMMKTYLVWNPGNNSPNDFIPPCNENNLNVCAVYGDIGNYWRINNTLDAFGPPTGEEFWIDGMHRQQQFTHAYIKWNRQTLNVCAYVLNVGKLINGLNPGACCAFDSGPGCG
jgi:uncharacterized protein with LGFP repeats